MAKYAFNNLSKEIKSRPQMLSDVVRFIKNLCSPSFARLAQGKTKETFASVVLQVLPEKKLSPVVKEFLAKRLFAYMENDATGLLLGKLTGISKKNMNTSLKTLQAIIEHSYLPKKKKKFSFFGRKKEKITATKFEETFTSSNSGRHAKVDETIATSEKEETLVASPLKKGSSRRRKARSSGRVAKQPNVNAQINKLRRKIKDEESVDQQFLNVLNHDDTISSSSPAKARAAKRKPGVIRRFTEKISNFAGINRAETVLSTSSPLQEADVESLRVETLVAFNKSSNGIPWVTIPQETALLKGRAQDLIKSLKGVSSLATLSREQRDFLTRLKNSLSIRTKLITAPQIVLNIINQGVRSYQHTLNRLSGITQNKKFNKKIREYLLYESEAKINTHADFFRQQLEKCLTLEQLEKFLDSYTLGSRSIFRKYPQLKVIKAVKKHKIKL